MRNVGSLALACGLALVASLGCGLAAPRPAVAWDGSACTAAGAWFDRQSAPAVAEVRRRFAPCVDLLFATVDTDESGGLSPAELDQVTGMVIHMIADSPQANAAAAPLLVRLTSLAPVLARAVFVKIDYDRSGEITRTEVLDDRSIALGLQAVRIVNTAQAAPTLQQALRSAVPALFGLLQ